MIEKIDTGISPNTNKRIIHNLFLAENWRHASDNSPDEKHVDRADAGFILTSHDLNMPHVKNDFLNASALMISDMVEKNTYLNFAKIHRIFWNWYNPNSLMDYHQDDNRHNRWSIVYNLHSTDGGTEFKNVNNENNIFHQSVESQALLFPSVTDHRGVAPKEKLNRFSLNIMVEI